MTVNTSTATTCAIDTRTNTRRTSSSTDGTVHTTRRYRRRRGRESSGRAGDVPSCEPHHLRCRVDATPTLLHNLRRLTLCAAPRHHRVAIAVESPLSSVERSATHPQHAAGVHSTAVAGSVVVVSPDRIHSPDHTSNRIRRSAQRRQQRLRGTVAK
jgi:hypothetical protein